MPCTLHSLARTSRPSSCAAMKPACTRHHSGPGPPTSSSQLRSICVLTQSQLNHRAVIRVILCGAAIRWQGSWRIVWHRQFCLNASFDLAQACPMLYLATGQRWAHTQCTYARQLGSSVACRCQWQLWVVSTAATCQVLQPHTPPGSRPSELPFCRRAYCSHAKRRSGAMSARWGWRTQAGSRQALEAARGPAVLLRGAGADSTWMLGSHQHTRQLWGSLAGGRQQRRAGSGAVSPRASWAQSNAVGHHRSKEVIGVVIVDAGRRTPEGDELLLDFATAYG